jgi:phosphatidylinositol alpha-mannosyltransferase
MKIGIITEYYYPTLGGIQEHVHHFACAARDAGHDVRILTPEVGDRMASRGTGFATRRKDEEHGVIRVGRSIALLSGGSLGRASVGLNLSSRLREILESEKFDVLHLHSPLMPTLPMLALRLSETVNVGTFHSDFSTNFFYTAFRPLMQRYMDRLDAAIGVSDTALRGIRRYFHGRFRIVPNGVDVPLFASGRRRPEHDDGRVNVLHVGRFDPRNGVDRVINAWVKVRRRGIDCRLLLVGDGPLRPQYEAMVPPSLRRDAHFLGFVVGEDRPDFYATGDVLLCPAVGGTFGIILLEAMAAGCAIVAADTAGFRNVMQDGVQGSMVDLAADPDGEKLADACARLVSDVDFRRRAAQAGRRTASRFDWPRVTEQVIDIYRELIAGRPRQADLDP